MEHHETSMLDAFRALTLQPDKAGPVEIAALLGEVAHFLRNDAAAKDVRIQVAAAGEIRVTADRATLKSLLLGLLLAALDALPDGAAGCAPLPLDAPLRRAGGRIPAPDLALLFADRFLNAQGGRLEIDPETPPHGALRVYYPTVA
jgi:signal transduction histidine kinase